MIFHINPMENKRLSVIDKLSVNDGFFFKGCFLHYINKIQANQESIEEHEIKNSPFITSNHIKPVHYTQKNIK